MEEKKMIKKSNFQKEIERDEKRLEAIYNKILGIDKPENDLKVPPNSCLLH